VFQDPREIKTKFRKPIETTFLPVREDITAIVRDWVAYLTTRKLYGPNDPLFPKTAVRPDEHCSFAVRGLMREHWANATPVRQIFRTAFAPVNLPYVRPHSIRDTVTQLAYKLQPISLAVALNAAAATKAVKFGKLWDGHGTIANAVVIVENDKIQSVAASGTIPAGAEIIDLIPLPYRVESTSFTVTGCQAFGSRCDSL
jgi:hypothetical protein